MSDHSTYGQFAADALIAAKRAGKQFAREALASELDRLLSEWKAATEFSLSSDCPKNQIPPTPEAVTAYARAIGYQLDGSVFCDSYASKGWIVGRTKMKDWQAAVRNWKRNGWGTAPTTTKQDHQSRDYSRI